MFHAWLARTTLLQRQFHPDGLPEEGTPEWREYVEYNVVALIKELGELLVEVQTSPWKNVGIRDREHAAEEYVDVLHFVANLGVAIGLDDGTLNAVYAAKMQENRDRLKNGRSKPIVRDTHPVYALEEPV